METKHESRKRELTLEQKLHFIRTYEQSGNMSSVIRETDIGSRRTAYLWWHRYLDHGLNGLQPRPHMHKAPKTLPDEVIARIFAVHAAHPTWGRRRIAQSLRPFYPISPSGVGRIMQRSSLDTGRTLRQEILPSFPIPIHVARGSINWEDLRSLAEQGIRSSWRDDAKTAYQYLSALWRPFERTPRVWSGLIRHPSIGPLMMLSRVHLGHASMNLGTWRHAARSLQVTLEWMREIEADRRWLEMDRINPQFSSHWDDLWIEVHQYLAIVLREDDNQLAVGLLTTALSSLFSQGRQSRAPTNLALTRGNVERDLGGVKKSQRRTSPEELLQHFQRSERNLELAGDRAVLAMSINFQADAYSTMADEARKKKEPWVHHLDQMQEALQRSLAILEEQDATMFQVNAFFNAAALYSKHGMAIDRDRLIASARTCLRYGFGGQIKHLLDLPEAYHLLPPELLRQLSEQAHHLTMHDSQRAP